MSQANSPKLSSQILKRSESAKPVAFWQGGLILSSESSSTPFLLVEIPEPPTAAGGQVKFLKAVDGLMAEVARYVLDDRDTWALRLEPRMHSDLELFNALAEFLLEKLPQRDKSEATLHGLESELQRWVEFFHTSTQPGSYNQLLGLCGELLAIRDLLAHDTFDHVSWHGPFGGVQDFIGTTSALEVKVSGRRTGPLIHSISSIGQLEPPSDLKLYLYSLRAKFVPNGGESFQDLVGSISSLKIFSGPLAQRHFWDAVKLCGYSNELDQKFERFEIYEKRLFEISPGFPSLGLDTQSLDSRIFDISYKLDFSALGAFELEDFENHRLDLNGGTDGFQG